MFLLYHPNSCKSKKMKTENNHLRSVLNLPFLILNCLLYFLLIPQPAFGQGEMGARQSFAQAESEYQIGRIDNAITIVNANVSHYDGTLKSGAYRLLALCYLAQDNIEEANRYVDLLLQEDPYYSITVNDPERFAELIRNKKEGKTTLVTASQQAETLEEAPVPVTLITEEMIKAIGARDLRDVLAAYVPGITIVEGNEHNISMHGIYNVAQDKILIMLNGHRLNSRSTNAEAPDFRNSLDKIKQIEVLRGPASSLYGNVALTAVVNIITKSGNDVNGLKISYGMGDNSTIKGDMTFGKRFFDFDVFVWASIYSSDGEKRSISPNDKEFIGIIPINGSMQIEGFNHKPAYDLGFTMHWNKIKLTFNQQYSKKVFPYTSAALHPTIYTYDKYRLYNGMKPGHGRLATRGDLSYEDSKGNFSWNAHLFIDAEEHTHYDISGDTLNTEDSHLPITNLQGEYIKDSILIQSTGVYQILEWKDYAYGGSISGNYKYEINKNAKGNILLGAQIENYKMYYNLFLLGDQFDRTDITYSDRNRQIELGNEFNFSVFTQIKHYFNQNFIFNGGLRYDYKYRFNDKKQQAFSPRLSLIYNINKIWNLKLGYSRSFVDAPFFYRANKTNRYKGSENLNPEYINAIQLSASAFFENLNLRYDCNIYYNKLKDLIYFDTSKERGEYVNSGKLDMSGIENVLSYDRPSFKASWNMSYQYILKAENYPVSGHRINNIPSFTSNLIMTGKLFSKREHSLWLRGNVSFYSKQNSPITNNIYKNSNISLYNPEYTIDARAIVNIGGIYKWNLLELSLQCYNIFNTKYYQGGSHISYAVPQLGRSFLATIAYTIQ